MAPERSVVARRIEEIRISKNLSRQDLAVRMGTTRLQIWRIETGVKDVSANEAALAAEALEVSIGEIYGESAA